MSCGVGHRRGSDPMLLWLRRRPAATAPIRPLAWNLHMLWEQPKEIAKRQKDKKKKKKKTYLGKKKKINLTKVKYPVSGSTLISLPLQLPGSISYYSSEMQILVFPVLIFSVCG